MDYMTGRRLDEVWDTSRADQKFSIAEQLHHYISQLRDLKGDYIGGVDFGKLIIGQHGPLEDGPFELERMFNEFI
ncbi:Phosphotransferase enzyme family [Aspergillus sclerotialis]|uniref:Phosphotransferase enzyme family n=1 Tax=Aspergillus sclerotialis TaxID=2070753 RepID=A0A3A2ZS64_9EURO|nr:Phosphotransferase enzyme family [Aspergillus sclerotialis]